MYHQQLQGVPKNKKSSSAAARSKAAQAASKAVNTKDSNSTVTTKESTPKKEKKIAATQSNASKKEQSKKLEDKMINVIDPNLMAAERLAAFVQSQQQTQKVSPTMHQLVVTTTTATTTTLTLSKSNNAITATSTMSAQTSLPSINVQQVNHSLLNTNQVEKECPVTVISPVVEPKQQPQLTVNAGRGK